MLSALWIPRNVSSHYWVAAFGNGTPISPSAETAIRDGYSNLCLRLLATSAHRASAASYFSDQGGKSRSGRDAVVTELDEQGREVGTTGPDPSRPKGSIWYKQTVEGAMNRDSSTTPPASDGPDEDMDRRSPGGPTAEDLDPLRPT
ncbi:hypothetical protein VaNZ11_000969, partial [Volvox africanus]